MFRGFSVKVEVSGEVREKDVSMDRSFAEARAEHLRGTGAYGRVWVEECRVVMLPDSSDPNATARLESR